MTYEHKDNLEALVSQGLVSKRKHPEQPLWVYNYTPKAVTVPWQEWGAGDYIALSDARGLILDEEYNIVGRGFRKFWNYEQVKDQIPWDENCQINKKWDGSLIIVCWYKDYLVIATRGSFESDQAIFARNFFLKHKMLGPLKGTSALYEAIYPENKIVIDYGQRQDLIWLDVIDNNTGLSIPWPTHKWAHKTTTRELETKLRENITNEEGYVVTFYPSCFRVKIKFDDYVKLHRIRFQTSTHSIWEILRTSGNFVPVYDLVEGLPKDLADKIKHYAFGLSAQVADLNIWIRKQREKIQSFQNNDWSEKAIAEWIKKQKHPQILFAVWRGKAKETEKLVWKAIEPKKEPLV